MTTRNDLIQKTCVCCNDIKYARNTSDAHNPYICVECYENGNAAKRLLEATELLMSIRDFNDHEGQVLYKNRSPFGYRVLSFLSA